jgi:hypothetical protein
VSLALFSGSNCEIGVFWFCSQGLVLEVMLFCRAAVSVETASPSFSD